MMESWNALNPNDPWFHLSKVIPSGLQTVTGGYFQVQMLNVIPADGSSVEHVKNILIIYYEAFS